MHKTSRRDTSVKRIFSVLNDKKMCMRNKSQIKPANHLRNFRVRHVRAYRLNDLYVEFDFCDDSIMNDERFIERLYDYKCGSFDFGMVSSICVTI